MPSPPDGTNFPGPTWQLISQAIRVQPAGGYLTAGGAPEYERCKAQTGLVR